MIDILDKIVKQTKTISDVFLDVIYPQTCGICGKINKNSLCKKCNLRVDKEFNPFFDCSIKDKYFNTLICFFKYEGFIRKVLLDFKFRDKAFLYKTIVKMILKQEFIFEFLNTYDTIIPIPISKKRRYQRGYNQSELIAKEIANFINIEYKDNCLVKVKNIIEQSKLNKEQRRLNIQDAYLLKNERDLKDKKLILLDDIYTTGSTVNEVSRNLVKVEPKSICVLTIAKD